MPLRIAVMISGRGSNLAAIQRAIDDGHCDAQISGVVSDQPGAPGLAFAAERGMRTTSVRMRDYTTREAWDAALGECVAELEPQLVVMAGFMRVVGPNFLSRFSPRVINVHPSLLPAFPGSDGPSLALAAKVRISGCTVHIVDAGVDSGPIIAQAAVPVASSDTRDSLHARIQRAEHQLLPRVIDAIARGRIRLEPTLHIDASHDEPAPLVSPRFDDTTP